MANKKQQSSISCAENIALLSMLDQMPTTPDVEVSAAFDQNLGHTMPEAARILPFEREKELAVTLAFLAGISDDLKHVMAVCVEEDPAGRGIKVLVAINKRAPDDGHEVLDRAQEGLQKVFTRIRENSRKDKGLLEAQVYRDITSLCCGRILSRMRSRRCKLSRRKSKKPFIARLLRQFVKALEKRTLIEPKSLLEESKYLLAALENFENPKLSPLLEESLAQLVIYIHRYMKGFSLKMVLETIPDKEMGSSMRSGLLNSFSKVARYRDCAAYICRMAWRYPIIRNARLEQVHLEPSAFERPDGNSQSSLWTILERMSATHDALNLKLLRKQHPKTAPAMDPKLIATVREIIKNSKIHAEIQILAHYERQPSCQQPRIIASSKNACFLCASLIRLHGKFSTPETHGKLYTAWKLPAFKQFESLQNRLNILLESIVIGAIPVLSDLKKRRLMSSVNESTVFPIRMSMTTLAGSLISGMPQSSSTVKVVNLDQQDNDSSQTRAPLEASTQKNSSVTSNKSEVGKFVEKQLMVGETVVYRHVEGSIFCFSTAKMHLFVDHTACDFSVEWLGAVEATRLLEDGKESIFAIESLPSGVDVSVPKHGSNGATYLSHGGDVVIMCPLKNESSVG